jgi:hypothetical protein
MGLFGTLETTFCHYADCCGSTYCLNQCPNLPLLPWLTRHVLTIGMACVGKCFESKISKPTKLDCKQNFYCAIYYITLNSNCEAQRASKNLKKIVEDRVLKSKIIHE